MKRIAENNHEQTSLVPKSESSTENLPEELPGEIIRLGKDELNLIEHPFAAMWDKETPGAVIHHEWEARHPITDKVVKGSWRVAGDPEMGLPKPSDERVYLVLLELTREGRFQNQAVPFTRYEVLTRLGWANNPKHYQMLHDAFKRLQSVKIQADNAFWDARAKSFRNVGFSIIDNFDILNEKPGRKSKKAGQTELPMSYFRWNDVMFHSFQTGYMRTLDLGFALSLRGDITLRLYRYLDKKSYDGRGTFEIELSKLCELHLGMRAARYASTHKARLKAAHEELIERNFLSAVVYEPMKSKKGEKVCYLFPVEKPALPQNTDGQLLKEANRDSADTPAVPDLLDRMLELKISPEVARALLQSVPAETLREQLDCLNDREPRDHAATFIKAVREGWQLPGKYLERVEAQNRARDAKAHNDAKKSQQAAQEAAARQEKALQEEESGQLDALWEKLDLSTREEIESQARQRLGVLGQSGRAQGALVAMRRNLLRERLGQSKTGQ